MEDKYFSMHPNGDGGGQLGAGGQQPGGGLGQLGGGICTSAVTIALQVNCPNPKPLKTHLHTEDSPPRYPHHHQPHCQHHPNL